MPPDADALLALFSRALYDRDLRIGAHADRGDDMEAHLAARRDLVREYTLALLGWEPREALQLTRWNEPPHDPAYVRAHRRRAFACVALLRGYGEPENHDPRT